MFRKSNPSHSSEDRLLYCANLKGREPPVLPRGYNRLLLHQSQIQPRLAHLLLSLLVQIRLDTTLHRLALVVLSLPLGLLCSITRKTSNGTANRTANTVGDTLAQVTELALSLLALALLVLLDALLLQALGADETANEFLAGTDSLVP